MRASRSARCLFNISSISKTKNGPQCRKFHASTCLPERRRPRFASIKASDMGLVSISSSKKSGHGLRPYDDKEKVELAKQYTPEQLRVIEEGEAAIDLDDVVRQGRFRIDPYRLPYLDDLSTIQPVVDDRPKEESTIPENGRWMGEEERINEVAQWINKEHNDYLSYKSMLPSPNSPKRTADEEDAFKPSRLDFMKFLEESTSMTGGGKGGSTVLAPTLPKIPSMKGQYQTKEGNDPRDPDGKYTRLLKQTGMSLDEVFDLRTKVLVWHSVTNQTRLGKIRKIYALAVAGDKNGRLGIGEGKAIEIDDARHKSIEAAIRNLRPIPRYEERTIYGEVEGKVAACEVRLMNRPPGFGLRCQHNIFEMARCAGIHDLAARVPRGRNKMNTIKATYQALLSQRIPDEIARGRGKKLVDVRKVYYGGDQPVAVGRQRRDGRDVDLEHEMM